MVKFMGKYKPSYYNIEIKKDHNGRTLVANLATLTIAWLNPEYDSFLSANCSEQNPITQKLASKGFLVDYECDEIQETINNRNKYINGNVSNTLVVLIAPTLSCNYSCKYCFENDVAGGRIITETEAQRIVDFIKSAVRKKPNCNHLHLLWFGGEPLLAYDRIIMIGSALLKWCTYNEIDFTSNITTNGLFLSRDRAQTMHDLCHLKTAQITVDGNAKYYAEIKQTNEANFYRVVENIKNINDIFKVLVRVNVNKQNEQETENLIKYLLVDQDLNGKIELYLAPIVDYHANNVTSLYTQTEFLDFYERLHKKQELAQLNFVAQNYLPHIRLAHCDAMARDYRCIGPDLKLYRCEHYIGRKEYSIGDIIEDIDPNNDVDKYFLSNLPEKCNSCKYVRICQGGCQANRYLDHIPVDCDHMRDLIIWQINNLLKAKAQQS